MQSSTGFVIGDYSKIARATIFDDDALPTITIANPRLSSESAGSVRFTLTADVTENTDLDVAFTVANETGDFLGTQTPVSGPLAFRQIGGNGDYVATIDVTLDDDEVVESDGSVSVTLLTDMTYPFSYKVGAINKGIAMVNDDDTPGALPLITVATVSDKERINEGQNVEFVFSATPDLTSSLDVSITLSEEGGNFLAAGQNTSTVSLSAGNLTKSFNTNVANGTYDPDSIVTLTILEDNTKYIVGNDNTANVVVQDTSTPTGISIIALEEFVTEGDISNPTADFQIKADRVDSLPRKISITAGSVTIPAGSRFAFMSYPIVDDSDFEGNRTLSRGVQPANSFSDSYVVAREYNFAHIKIIDDDFPTADAADAVSIVAERGNVGESNLAQFQLVAKTTFQNARTVKVQVTNKGSSDFLAKNRYDDPIDVVIDAGELDKYFHVTLDDDDEKEANGEIVATILPEDVSSGGTRSYSVSSINSAEITVIDNDTYPVISISSSAEMTGVTEGYTFDFEVTSDRDLDGSPLDVYLDVYNSFNGIGATISGMKVTIPGNARTVTGTVMNIGDVYEASPGSIGPFIRVSIRDSADYWVNGGNWIISVNVKDNDATSPTNPRISIAAASNESVRADLSETADFVITSSDQTNGKSVFVSVSRTGNFITPITEVPVLLSDEQTTTPYKVPTTDPNLGTDHPDGSVTVTILEKSGYTLADSPANQATVTIVDTPAIPVLNWVDLTNNISEGTHATDTTDQNIVVQLYGGATASNQIIVDYTLSGLGDTNIPKDVKLASNAPGRISDSAGRITLAVGESSVTIPLEIIADAYDEANDQFKLTLSNVSGAMIGMATTTATIEDDDATPTVSIANSVPVTESDADADYTMAVTLNAVSGRTVTVPYTVNAVSATADVDFVLADGMVTFDTDANTTITSLTEDITFTIKGDNIEENTEQFTITLGTPINASIVGQNITGTVTITDDDAPPVIPTISFADRDLSIGEANGTITIPITLSGIATNYPVQLDWSIVPWNSYD